MSSTPGLVLVLDGPAGVGKTTMVAALQDAWADVRPGPLVEAGIDRTLDALGEASLSRWWELIERYDRAEDDEGHGRVTWGPLGRELVGAMHRAAAAWSRAGFDVVMDHVLLDRATATDLAEVLQGLPVLHVGLTCDPDELAAREERRDPPATVGRAVAQLRVAATVATRDIVVDTTDMPPERVVAVVLDAVADLVAETERGPERRRPPEPRPERRR